MNCWKELFLNKVDEGLGNEEPGDESEGDDDGVGNRSYLMTQQVG